MEQKIKILVVDDHALVRNGIISILIMHPDFEVIGEAENGQEALEKIEKFKPDVVLLDISLPDITGIEVLAKAREKEEAENVKFLMVTMFDTKEYYYRAIKTGASGVINKNAGKAELFEGVLRVFAGEQYFGENITMEEVEKIIHEFDKKKFESTDPEKVYLTEREWEILIHLHDGLLSKQIAEKLAISSRTVDIHRSNIMQKFQVTSMHELFAKIDTSEKLKRIMNSREIPGQDAD